MIKLKTSYFIAGAVIFTAVAMPLSTYAKTGGQGIMTRSRAAINRMMPWKNRLSGTVTAINGNTLTVTDAKGVVYTVDASTAKIGDAVDSLSLANILVGDKVVVTGTITGTNDVAKTISDASMINRNIFMGTVTATSGTMFTITTMVNKVATVYTVNAASTTVFSGPANKTVAMTINDIKVGDRLVINGMLSGSTVTATKVRDLGQKVGKGKNHQDKTTNMFSGKVTAISGSKITISGMRQTTYTIDASKATLTKGMGKTATIMTVNDIAVGDKVFAVGTLTGTDITATSVRDLGQTPKKIGHNK